MDEARSSENVKARPGRNSESGILFISLKLLCLKGWTKQRQAQPDVARISIQGNFLTVNFLALIPEYLDWILHRLNDFSRQLINRYRRLMKSPRVGVTCQLCNTYGVPDLLDISSFFLDHDNLFTSFCDGCQTGNSNLHQSQ